jgi:hypothetical protein
MEIFVGYPVQPRGWRRHPRHWYGQVSDRPAYTVHTVRASELTPEQTEALWRCYEQFVDCPRHLFMRSLSMAETIYLFRDKASAAISGFEAMRTTTIVNDGRKHTVIYTFYADLEPRIRGLSILQRIGLRRYCGLRLRHPFRPLYWMFTASTYLSYLLLPHNLIEYWPHPDHRTPPQALRVMALVVEALGLKGWDAHSGVLRRNNQLQYREGLVGERPDLASDRFVRFYSSLNPEQNEGDSVVCLCPLNFRNFLFALYRMLSRERQAEHKDR